MQEAGRSTRGQDTKGFCIQCLCEASGCMGVLGCMDATPWGMQIGGGQSYSMDSSCLQAFPTPAGEGAPSC